MDKKKPEDILSRIVNVEFMTSQAEKEMDAIRRIVRAYVELEKHQPSPMPHKAMEAAMDDLYILGVIQHPGAPLETPS